MIRQPTEMAYPQPVNILPSPNLSQRSHGERRSERSYSQKSVNSRASMRSSTNGIPVSESRGMEASHILDQLQKEIVFLTGGRDRQGGPLLTFPPHRDMYFLPNDITACLRYLSQIPSEESKRRGFTAIIDSRDGSWSNLVTVLGCLKQSLGDYLKQVLVLRQDGMGQRQSSSNSFRRDRGPNIEPQFVNLNRLYTYVDRNQLMASMGGTLMYNHSPWLQNRLGLEKFMREARAAASHLDTAESEITYQQRSRAPESPISPVEALQQHRYFQDSILSVPNQVLHQGKDLLQKLQHYSDVAMRGEESVTTLDNLEAQKQVKRTLQYFENRVDKVAGYLETRDRSLNIDVQRDGVQREIRQVVEWILGPGEKLLASQYDIGDSYDAAETLRKRHEEMEIKCTDTYGHYAELRHRVDDLLQESMTGAEDIRAQRDYMDTVCRSFASRLERRRTLLITSVRFHRLTEEFARKLDDLLEILYNDNVADTVEAAKEALEALQERVDAIDTAASRAMTDGYSLLDEMSRPIKNAFGKDISPDYASQIKHVNQKLEELQERKMRCDDLADVRKLKLQQMLQLRTCEKDALQAITWIVELCEVMAKSHTHIGQTQQETDSLQDEHRRVENTAFGTYEYGKQLLQAGLVLRRSLRLTIEPNNMMSHDLEEAWKRFSGGNNERANRLNVASMFLSQSEKQLERVEGLMVVVAQTLTGDLAVPEALARHTREKQEVESECQETERMGKALLERLALPIIVVDGQGKEVVMWPDSKEKRLSTEDQTATDIINNRLRKMDYKLSELNRYWSEMQQTGQPPSVTPKITKSFKPYAEEVSGGQRPSLLQRTPSDRSFRSGSLPASRTSSFNRSGDSQRWKKKGPITKHGTRRRTVDSAQGAKDQSNASRKNDAMSTGTQLQNGQRGLVPEQQIRPNVSHQQQHSRPHVSQSYYPKSEEFSRQIPPASYSSYQPHTRQEPEPEPMWEDVRPSVQQPAESRFEPQQAPYTYSHSGGDLESQLESQILPDVSNSLQPASVDTEPGSSIASSSKPSSQYYPDASYDIPDKLSKSSLQYGPDASSSSSNITDKSSKLSSSSQNIPETTSKSSSHYIPDTLPISRSQPNVTRSLPPKVDIRHRFPISSRRSASPPLNFKDLLSKFQGGDIEKPKDNKDKEAVQKEISQVMKSRASMLDHEDAIQPRSEIIRPKSYKTAESLPPEAMDEESKDDGGLKAQLDEVNYIFACSHNLF